MYPLLEVNIKKLEYNLDYIKSKLAKEGILLTGVLKGCACLPAVVDMYKYKGIHSIGSSRMYHLRRIKEDDANIQAMLLRIPALCEVEDVIKYTEISLNSERITLDALNQMALKYNKVHKIILMFDLGDLREGCFDVEELLKLGEFVEKASNLYLLGIGTNLSCYGSIKPTKTNMDRLVEVAEILEDKIGRRLEIISGGATSTIPLIDEGILNSRINHLRVGEQILNNKDLPFYHDIHYPMYDDAFILKLQIVELKTKPSRPIGQMSIDAFGNTPEYEDRGLEKRAICSLGNLDVGSFNKLVPVDKNVHIVGASSDHLIVRFSDEVDYEVGSVMDFEVFYPAMLYLTNSAMTDKKYVYDISEKEVGNFDKISKQQNNRR